MAGETDCCWVIVSTLFHDFGLYLNPKGRLKQYFQTLEILLNQLNG